MTDHCFNAEQIMEVLPHRPPFLLVDRITRLEEGVGAAGVRAVSMTDPVFQGHFPGAPIYPGVLIVEALAQVGAFALLYQAENRGRLAYFTRIQNARFYAPVSPGDMLTLSTRLTKQRLNVGFAEGEAYVGDTLVCKAEIAFALGEQPSTA